MTLIDDAEIEQWIPPLSFEDLQHANVERQKEWDPEQGITDEYRGNEAAGEIGEALEEGILLLLLGAAGGRVSNMVKKLARERLGLRGSRVTNQSLAEELADAIICVALIANNRNIDLGEAVRAKFNATSEKYNLKTRL